MDNKVFVIQVHNYIGYEKMDRIYICKDFKSLENKFHSLIDAFKNDGVVIDYYEEPFIDECGLVDNMINFTNTDDSKGIITMYGYIPQTF